MMSLNDAKAAFHAGLIGWTEFENVINAVYWLHPVDGRYGHVSIGCKAARCTHFGAKDYPEGIK